MLRSLLALGCKSLHEGPSARRALLSAAQGSLIQTSVTYGVGDGIISLLGSAASTFPSRAETVTRSLHTCCPIMISSSPQHQCSTNSVAVSASEESQILTAEILPPSRPDLVARVSSWFALSTWHKGQCTHVSLCDEKSLRVYTGLFTVALMRLEADTLWSCRNQPESTHRVRTRFLASQSLWRLWFHKL